MNKRLHDLMMETFYQVFLIIGAIDIGISLALPPTNFLYFIGGIVAIIIAIGIKDLSNRGLA